MNEEINEMFRCIGYDHIQRDSQKKIAQAAKQILVALNGLSKFETEKTMQMIDALLQNHMVVSLSNTEETCLK